MKKFEIVYICSTFKQAKDIFYQSCWDLRNESSDVNFISKHHQLMFETDDAIVRFIPYELVEEKIKGLQLDIVYFNEDIDYMSYFVLNNLRAYLVNNQGIMYAI